MNHTGPEHSHSSAMLPSPLLAPVSYPTLCIVFPLIPSPLLWNKIHHLTISGNTFPQFQARTGEDANVNVGAIYKLTTRPICLLLSRARSPDDRLDKVFYLHYGRVWKGSHATRDGVFFSVSESQPPSSFTPELAWVEYKHHILCSCILQNAVDLRNASLKAGRMNGCALDWNRAISWILNMLNIAL